MSDSLRHCLQSLELALNDSKEILEVFDQNLRVLGSVFGRLPDVDPNMRNIYFNDVNALRQVFRECWLACKVVKEELTSFMVDQGHDHVNVHLSRTTAHIKGTIERAIQYLISVESMFSRVLSELKIITQENQNHWPTLKTLENSLIEAQKIFYQSLHESIRMLIESDSGLFSPVEAPILKKDVTDYRLPCSICGRTAITVKIAVPRYESELRLVYEGITHATGYPLQHADVVFDLLEKGELKELHDYFIQELGHYEGLDGYCPDCDAVYCAIHYDVQEIWDEGFYDYSIGRCPLGHERMIDD